MAIESINPATGEKLETYTEMRPPVVEDIVNQAHEAFLAWRRMSFDQRAQRLRAAA
jgi:succinate-semialdehyde dehydrogenase / glutarate-semialdehyde dehydrogenase